MITPLSQRAPICAELCLGQSDSTIGRYGCTITCLSMASEYFHSVNPSIAYRLPQELAKTLKFTSEGLLIWESLSSIGMKKENRFYGANYQLINEALAHPKKVCLIQVKMMNGFHWVLALSKVPGTNDTYNVADPWYGDRSTTRRYKNQISGGAVISIP